MRNVYAPGASLLDVLTRPWNATLFTPAWPANESEPTVTVRVHRLRLGLRRFGATHVCGTLRPWRTCVKVKVTDACTFRENENVVPSGGLRGRWARPILASARPARHFFADSRAAPITGFGGAVTTIGALEATAVTSSGSGYVAATEHATWWPMFATVGVYETPEATADPSSSQR